MDIFRFYLEEQFTLDGIFLLNSNRLFKRTYYSSFSHKFNYFSNTICIFFSLSALKLNRLKLTESTTIISISNFLNNLSQFIFKTVHHNRAYTVSVGLKYTDCFTSVVDKVKTLIKTVCCPFAVGLRRVNGRRESWQLRKAQGSPAFQHIVLVSDSARRESSARSGAGSIGWVVQLLKLSCSFFLLSL